MNDELLTKANAWFKKKEVIKLVNDINKLLKFKLKKFINDTEYDRVRFGFYTKVNEKKKLKIISRKSRGVWIAVNESKLKEITLNELKKKFKDSVKVINDFVKNNDSLKYYAYNLVEMNKMFLIKKRDEFFDLSYYHTGFNVSINPCFDDEMIDESDKAYSLNDITEKFSNKKIKQLLNFLNKLKAKAYIESNDKDFFKVQIKLLDSLYVTISETPK